MFGTRKGINQLGGGCHFLGIFTIMQLPKLILEISTACIRIVLYERMLVHCDVPSMLLLSSSFSQCLSHLFVGLRVIGELDSFFKVTMLSFSHKLLD